jgi:hypothetical protein
MKWVFHAVARATQAMHSQWSLHDRSFLYQRMLSNDMCNQRTPMQLTYSASMKVLSVSAARTIQVALKSHAVACPANAAALVYQARAGAMRLFSGNNHSVLHILTTRVLALQCNAHSFPGEVEFPTHAAAMVLLLVSNGICNGPFFNDVGLSEPPLRALMEWGFQMDALTIAARTRQ